MVKRILLLSAAVLLSIPVFADGELSMELNLQNLILWTRTEGSAAPYWGWSTAGSSALSFKSSGNKNVKADLAFSFVYPEQQIAAGVAVPLLKLDRAYVKSRFPGFRITAGKTRIGWGDGFVFNSADVIFGSTDPLVDLTATEIRTETRWLASLNIPIERFSFFEITAAPPAMSMNGGLPQIGKMENFSAGGRIYGKIGEIKSEAGYWFDNSEGKLIHKPYIALQGNLISDWYLNASASLAGTGDFEQIFKDSLNISGGLFHIISINSISSLSLRFETLCRPFLSWSEQPAGTGGIRRDYALLLYPELNYKADDSLSLYLRSVVSPLDISAMLTAGTSWNIFEGYTLSFAAVVNIGDGDDVFSFSRSASLWQTGTDIIDGSAFVIGINFIY